MSHLTSRLRHATRDEGFTLVEIMVVIVILISLAAIGIPVFLNQKDRADQAADEATISRVGQFVSAGIAAGTLTSTAGEGVIAGGTVLSSTIGMISTEAIVYGTYDINAGTFCVTDGTYMYSNTSGGTAVGDCT